jgi:tetratricopeptide (TPR) repeat protein
VPRRPYSDTLGTLGGSPFVDTISNGSVSSGGRLAPDEPPIPSVFGEIVTESLEGEIRTLRSLFWSDHDPDGRGFAPLADAYRRAGDARQALELLADGLDRHPDFTPGHVVKARLYVEQGLYTEAEIAARRVLDLDPENVDALRSLVRALEEEGEAAEAAKMREQLATLEPELVEVGTSSDDPPAVSDDVSAASTDVSAVSDDESTIDDDVSTSDEAVVSVPVDEAMDFSALAPEEPAASGSEVDFDPFALGELPEEKEIVADFGALTPDESEAVAEEEKVFDFGALAPDEPVAVAEEEIAEFGALAPDEPQAVAEEEEVFDFGVLAPDEPEAAEEEIADFGALAPDEPATAAEEEIADFGALAPDEPEAAAEEEIADFGALAPDEPETAAADEPAEQIQTRTLADLYVTQDLIDRAIDVYERLVDADPDDVELRERLGQLRSGDQETESASGGSEAHKDEPEAAVQAPEADEGDDGEVETLARDLAGSGDDEHDVDTPFAWGEEDDERPTDVEEGPSIAIFFDDLLSYGRSSESGES